MTQSEFTHIIENLGNLSPDQMRQLRRELDGKLASAAPTTADPTPDPLLGLWQD